MQDARPNLLIIQCTASQWCRALLHIRKVRPIDLRGIIETWRNWRVSGRETGVQDPATARLHLAPDEKTIVVYLLELPLEGADKSLRELSTRFAGHRFVFVHSSTKFQIFHEANVIFEALPSLEQMRSFPSLLDWGAWVADRLALLETAWSPERSIFYGTSPQDYLSQARHIAAGGVSRGGTA